MGLPLFFSSILSGIVATTVMAAFLYLPVLWRGVYYDTLGAIGSIFTRKVDVQSRLIGAVLLLFGGILFAFMYGWFALMFMRGTFGAPHYQVFPTWPVEIDLFYVLLGLVGGMGQGMFLSLITTFIITDFHPVESYRQAFPLILSFIIGHTVYGVVVMFMQSQLLQLFMAV
jgi:hypothetical protein